MTTTQPQALGVVGLGRMGANIARRLRADGHTTVVHDINPAAVAALAAEGATGADSLAALAAALPAPRAIWVMVPAGRITLATITAVAEVLEPGDTIIDGGNTHYTDDLRHAAALRERGIHHIDVGTSGGVWGAERGYCLMIGGEPDPVARLTPIFASLAPGVEAAERTAGRSGDPA
ncbi:MAG TPA: NAD(P)-binding domain-containing protein, partial [Motilibacterales bacterium]|nr:NAD(P)-binding domain-containing protein [Motilibacterales bacterium]